MIRSPLIRLALAYLGLSSLVIGVWATLAPASFFADFPGGDRSWVAGDGPYNEHLVRDVGAWSLALAVVLLAAAWRPQRLLALVAAAAAAIAALPHAVYHSRHADLVGSTADQVASIGGLWFNVVVGAAVLVAIVTGRVGDRPASTG